MDCQRRFAPSARPSYNAINTPMNIVHVDRPWGSFDRFTNNEVSTVKILTVKPGQRLSLQYHDKREEFWHVIAGSGEAVIGDETKPAKAGDEFFIPLRTNHRFVTHNDEAQILEISFGEFDEADNHHVQDDYGRTVLDVSQDKEIVRGQNMTS